MIACSLFNVIFISFKAASNLTCFFWASVLVWTFGRLGERFWKFGGVTETLVALSVFLALFLKHLNVTFLKASLNHGRS